MLPETEIGTTSTRSSIERDSSRSTEPQQPDHRDEPTAENLVDDLETTATGHLERRIYWIYFTSIGLFLTLLIIISTAIMQASAIVLSLFWAYWATHQEDFTNHEFLLYSTSIVLITIISGFLRSILFAHGGINAAKVLYTKLSDCNLFLYHNDGHKAYDSKGSNVHLLHSHRIEKKPVSYTHLTLPTICSV